MKKTISVNLGSRVFTIDEDAYNLLDKYLKDINKRFSDPNSGEEIVSDVELRIAELFSQKINEGKQVITITDVEDIIKILGEPKDFNEGEEDDDPSRENKSTFKNNYYERAKYRRFYRNPDDRILGGVCGGLSAYFNVDPLIVRILMIIAGFIGFGVFLYIALWILVPIAQTTAQKLEMHGEKVNIDNIENKIKEEFEEVRKRFENIKSKKKIKQSKDELNYAFASIGNLIVVFIKIIFVFVGSILAFAGIVLLIIVLFSAFSSSIMLFDIDVKSILQFLSDNYNPNILLYSLVFLITSIFLSIIGGGLVLVFGKRMKWNMFSSTASLLWIVGMCLIIYSAFKIYQGQKIKEKVIFETSYQSPDTLFVNTIDIYEENEMYDKTFNFNKFNVAIHNSEVYFFGKPNIEIRKHESKKINILLKKIANGKSDKQAIINANNISFNYKIDDNILCLDKYFTLEKNKPWKFQKLEIIIYAPENMVIKFNNKTDLINIDGKKKDYAGETIKI